MAIIPGVGASSMHGAVVPLAYLSNLAAVSAFTNIPSGYQDLMVVINARGSRSLTSDDCLIRFNNDGSGINSWTFLQGDGSSATSARNTSGNNFIVVGSMPASNATSGIFGSIICHILNYANTSTYKTILSRSACDLNGSGYSQETIGLYRSTSAINRIDVTQYVGYTSGSTATLYGVRTVGQ